MLRRITNLPSMSCWPESPFFQTRCVSADDKNFTARRLLRHYYHLWLEGSSGPCATQRLGARRMTSVTSDGRTEDGTYERRSYGARA